MNTKIKPKPGCALVALFLILNIYLINRVFAYSRVKENGILTIEFLNVGQGDAILITAPNQYKILIDTSANETVVRELSKTLSYFDKKIDLILVTHADLDHIGGVPFITDKYKVDDLIFNFDINLSGITREINNKLGEYEITPVTVSAGDRIYLDRTNNIYLDILWSHPEFKNENKNENSIISHLNYKDISFMLTGDAGKEVENFLINIFDNKKIKSNVLKLGHHGSKTSTAELFVKSVAPQYAVVSAGEDNKFGHPHNEVMSTVGNTKTNIKILETKNGPVIFQTDGRNLWVNEI